MFSFLKKYIDFRLFKYLIIFYTVAVLLNMFKKVYYKYQGNSIYLNFSWFELYFKNIFLDWLVVLFLMIFISYFTKIMIKRKTNWKLLITIHFMLSLFLSYLIFTLTALISYLLGYCTIKSAIDNVTLNHFINVFDVNFLVYFSMLGIIYVYYYIKKTKKVEAQKTKLQNQLVTTKMTVLKAQLHPHFIFNTLNSISSLIEIDPEKSQNLIADFGDLFREIIAVKDDNLIPLKKELLFLDKYIDIISVRFSDHLVIHKKIESDIENALVPNMLLQPLIENAIKHGYSYDITELIVNLNIYKLQNYLYIKIENDGASLKNSFIQLLNNGTGLSNTLQRLKTLYKDDFEFVIKNSFDKQGVFTFIKIPLNKIP